MDIHPTTHHAGGILSLIARYSKAHKIFVSFVLLIVVGAGIFFSTRGQGASATRYVLAVAQKETIITTVDGSGQVATSNQLDIKPKVGGDVSAILVHEGQAVSAGTTLVRLDATDAAKAVRDAEANLESAQLALEKLTQPADAFSMLQAENALTQATQSKQNAQSDLAKAYDDGFNSVANAFIDLPSMMTGLDSILNGTTVNGIQANAYAYSDMAKVYKQNVEQFRDIALASYQSAHTAYLANLDDYKNASRYSDVTKINALISETYDTTKSISEATKNIKSFLDLVTDALSASGLNTRAPAILTTHENNLQTYTGTMNGHLDNLLSIKNTITNSQDAIVNADHAIGEKSASLDKLKSGPDPLDIKSQELSLTQRKNALLDAQETFAYASIRAPFDGTVAKINVKIGDTVSPTIVVATLIAPQRIAEVSFNEVDVAKIKIGQKATLTFDAFSDLSLTGSVAQVDIIGTVTQGVVTYNVKVAFDTEDDRVKPGMSVSTAVITDVHQDVLSVPNTAVKSQGGSSYVEVLEGVTASDASLTNQGITSTNPPTRRAVEVGVSDDTMTEITSGLAEGDLVVARTIAATTATAQPSSNTGVRIPGLTGGGGNVLRQGGPRN